jgi:hypothetical protein
MRSRRRPLDHYWRVSGLSRPTGLGRDDLGAAALADGLLEALGRRDSRPAQEVFALIEDDLARATERDDREAVERIAGFVETLQNASSWDDRPGPTEVLPLLGPNTTMVWSAADEFWQRVADAIPPKPKTVAVRNEQLRWLLIAGNRQVAPGLYSSTADAILYEKGYQA